VTLRCLRANVGERAEIVPVALSDRDGEVEIFQKPDSADTSLINRVGPSIMVEGRKLDTVLAEVPGRIRLIVGDAEGAEPEVLAGATETLKRTDFVSIEFGQERNGQATIAECTALLREAGFTFLPLKDFYIVAINERASVA
jgi:FkbM family methyltransferase